MKERIQQIVLEHLDEPDCNFVFPSDLAAASWLHESLRLSGKAALPGTRFISWDNFKDRVFPGATGKRPSSRLLRMFFSRSLLEENRRRAFLRHIIPPNQAEASLNFVRHLAQALPSLGLLASGITGRLTPLVAEWLDIKRRYADFLDDKALYEPGWLERQAIAPNQKYQLFFPDLTDDWPEYRTGLVSLPLVYCHCYEDWQCEAGSTESVGLADTTTAVSNGGARPLTATRFDSYLQEVRSVLLTIRQAARDGINPADMLISLTDMKTCLPVLQREAKIAGVPLDIREANPLSLSAGGRLLKDILTVAQSASSFAAMRRLLLDRSRPYNNPELIHELMQLALDKHILASIPDLDQDTWLASIPSDKRHLANFYTDIIKHCRKLSTAASFAAVRQHFDAFRRQCIREDAWTALQNDEIARCILVLEELDNTATELGLPAIDGCADLWYQQLEDSPYLPLSKTCGVPVYRFRVCAGCQPALHFVLNLSEQASRLEGRRLRFLREDERSGLNPDDRNLSAGIVHILAESGRRVYLSCSVEGPDGFKPPHPVLDLVAPAETDHQSESPRGRLSWRPELWLPRQDGRPLGLKEGRDGASTTGIVLTELFPLQKSSLAAALICTTQQPAVDYTEGKPDKPAYLAHLLKQELLKKLERDGRLAVNVSLIENYQACAFRYLLERSYRVAGTETGLSFLDRLLVGSIYHDTLQTIFQPLVDGKQTVVQPEVAGEKARPADQDLPAALDKTIRHLAKTDGPFVALMVEAIEPVLSRHLHRALHELRTILDGCIPWQNDQANLTIPFDENMVDLEGRPDLVCFSPGHDQTSRPAALVRLIDYKKKSIPEAKQLQYDEHGRPGKLQIPAYLLLLEGLQVEVEEAWYLGIEKDGSKKAKLKAYGADSDCVFQVTNKAPLLEAVRRECLEIAAKLRRAEIYVPEYKDLANTCQYCNLTSVCRQHYTVS